MSERADLLADRIRREGQQFSAVATRVVGSSREAVSAALGGKPCHARVGPLDDASLHLDIGVDAGGSVTMLSPGEGRPDVWIRGSARQVAELLVGDLPLVSAYHHGIVHVRPRWALGLTRRGALESARKLQALLRLVSNLLEQDEESPWNAIAEHLMTPPGENVGSIECLNLRQMALVLRELLGDGCAVTPTSLVPVLSERSLTELKPIVDEVLSVSEKTILGVPMTQRVWIKRIEVEPRRIDSRVVSTLRGELASSHRVSCFLDQERVADWKIWVLRPDQGQVLERVERLRLGTNGRASSEFANGEEWLFPRDLVHAFCEAIGDMNPFHLDRRLAQGYGLEDTNVPASFLGWFTLAKAEAEDVDYRWAELRFLRWVYVDQPVVLHRRGSTWTFTCPKRGPLLRVMFDPPVLRTGAG
jgi:hypothetical protein